MHHATHRQLELGVDNVDIWHGDWYDCDGNTLGWGYKLLVRVPGPQQRRKRWIASRELVWVERQWLDYPRDNSHPFHQGHAPDLATLSDTDSSDMFYSADSRHSSPVYERTPTPQCCEGFK